MELGSFGVPAMRTFLFAIGRVLIGVWCAVAAHAGFINLRWDRSSTADLAFYRVYLRDESGGFQVVKETPYEGIRLTDLAGGQAYYVTIRSVNRVGLESENSPEARVEVPRTPLEVSISAFSEERLQY